MKMTLCSLPQLSSRIGQLATSVRLRTKGSIDTFLHQLRDLLRIFKLIVIGGTLLISEFLLNKYNNVELSEQSLFVRNPTRTYCSLYCSATFSFNRNNTYIN